MSYHISPTLCSWRGMKSVDLLSRATHASSFRTKRMTPNRCCAPRYSKCCEEGGTIKKQQQKRWRHSCLHNFFQRSAVSSHSSVLILPAFASVTSYDKKSLCGMRKHFFFLPHIHCHWFIDWPPSNQSVIKYQGHWIGFQSEITWHNIAYCDKLLKSEEDDIPNSRQVSRGNWDKLRSSIHTSGTQHHPVNLSPTSVPQYQ